MEDAMKIYVYGAKWHLYPDCRGTKGELEEIDLEILSFVQGKPILAGSAELCTMFSPWVCGTCLRSKARIFKIQRMQKMRKEGKTMGDIGREFGVTRQRIYQYLEE
jgi:hypothetical protein